MKQSPSPVRRTTTALLLFAAAAHSQVVYRVDTVAGSAHPEQDARWATHVSLKTAYGIAFDNSGALLIADTMGNRIWRATPDARIEVIAGTGAPGDSGDGGPATEAQLNSPRDIAFGSNGQLYVSDNGKIRVISPQGVISTLDFKPAETDEGAWNPPRLVDPTKLTYDSRQRRLYVGEAYAVRYIDEEGVLHPFAGDGTSAKIAGVPDVALDENGDVYIGQSRPPRIWRVDAEGRPNIAFDSEQAVPTDAAGNVLWIESVASLALAPSGRLYFTDQVGGHIYAIEPDGALKLITPSVEGRTRGPLYFPTSLALTPQGDIYVSQFSLGVVTRLREGEFGEIVVGSLMRQGDGGPATEARLFFPTDIAFDALGNLYIADRDNAVVRRVSPAGQIETYAGNGARYPDTQFDKRPAPDVSLGFVLQVDTDTEGVYALGNYDIRAIRADRSVERLFSFVSGDKPSRLTAMQADGAGSYYVAMAERRQIWRYDAKANRGALIAGSGERGYGLAGPAASSTLLAPQDLTLDRAGNLYFIDGARDIHRVSSDGELTTIAAAMRPDEDRQLVAPTDIVLERPRGLAWGPDDALYVADRETIRRISWPEGGKPQIETIAGDGEAGFGGDGGPALQARFNWPNALAFDASGRLFVADRNNHRIRVLTPIDRSAEAAAQ